MAGLEGQHGGVGVAFNVEIPAAVFKMKIYAFLIHAADVEGKRSGIEENLVTVLGEWQQKSGFPVTYAGGVHSFDDLKLIGNLSGGRMDVTVGSALSLFGGDLSLEDLVKTANLI